MISFAQFLTEVRGHGPYPWQQSLADRLADEAPAPDVGPAPITIAVPTGSGKTTVVDVLVWALAAQADRVPRDRTVGTRIVWAIDRRILVDAVHAATTVLADRLSVALGSPDDVLHEMAWRLEHLKDPREPPTDAPFGPASPGLKGQASFPLIATRWRGGVAIPTLDGHPLQPEVITSTVAQIGSRLLFRGYGLGSRSLPLGAALATCDTTICLDEAHLAEPFAQTIDAIRDRRAERGDTLAPPLRLIRLSATPGRQEATADDAHRNDPDAPVIIGLGTADEATPALESRLRAPKVARLVEPAGTGGTTQEAALVAALMDDIEDDRRTIACVVNSVRTARAVFDRVTRTVPKADAILLIGPQRAVDRDDALDHTIVAADGRDSSPRKALFSAERPRDPLIVVATQTFEVGLDADVEALVTQSASASALTQRLGRLNRAGRLNAEAFARGEAPHPDGRATIVRHEGFPLYEDDEASAWEWLTAQLQGAPEAVDVSVAALRRRPPPPPRHPARAAELTDQAVELFTQTHPRPHRLADPDIDAYLRGVDSEPSTDVTVCWRADLCVDDVSSGANIYREALLQLAPPRPEEQLTLSIGAARNLLSIRTGRLRTSRPAQHRLSAETADVEGAPPPNVPAATDAPTFEGIPFLVRRGRDLLHGRPGRPGAADAPLGIGDIGPGDLLILPTALGGVDRHGLAVDAPYGIDVAADVRPSAPTTLGPNPGPPPIRLTHDALDVALRAGIPNDGPRIQRVRRILRRVATLERRLDGASGRDGRARQAREALIEELHDHPRAADLSESMIELRRISPELPSELTDPIDDPAGLFLGAPNTGEATFFDDDINANDYDDEEESESPAISGALFPGEEQPMAFGGWVLVSRRSTTPDRLRPRNQAPPTLTAHADAVTERARTYARAARLSDRLVRTIELAARVHDHGKADPRMQAFFYGGTAPPLAEPIAKSVFGTDDRRAERTARRASGLPPGWRHEQASAEILLDAWRGDGIVSLPEDPDRGVDLELAMVLTSGHHGAAHPMPPVPGPGTAARSFRVEIAGVAGTATGTDGAAWDSGAPFRRIERVTARYGPWTLAYLQALLVLADRTVSAEGS